MKVPGMDSLIGKSAKAVNRRQTPGVNPHQKQQEPRGGPIRNGMEHGRLWSRCNGVWTGFQSIEGGTGKAEHERNMTKSMEHGRNTHVDATASTGFFSSAKQGRQGGDLGGNHPPLKGGVFSPKKHSPLPMPTDRSESMAEWVRENLPTCAAVAAEFKAEFGDVRLVYASEGGHVLGTASDGGEEGMR
jgi:hypothetical protein